MRMIFAAHTDTKIMRILFLNVVCMLTYNKATLTQIKNFLTALNGMNNSILNDFLTDKLQMNNLRLLLTKFPTISEQDLLDILGPFMVSEKGLNELEEAERKAAKDASLNKIKDIEFQDLEKDQYELNFKNTYLVSNEIWSLASHIIDGQH